VRSYGNRTLRIAVSALFLALSARVGAVDQHDAAESPGPAEIAKALQTVKADPNLATERTINMLHWKDSAAKPRTSTPAWFAWIAGLFTWLGQSARVLMWGAILVLAALMVLFIVRLFGKHEGGRREAPFIAPTHVRDLDIRPETLPDDIGAAARQLWDSGEHRASLALLYRGLLSRLAHVHQIPIRDSSTEGDCLALAADHLAPGKREYASRVVRVWQRAVYGREQVESSIVYILCDEFGSAFGSHSPLATSPRGAA
jgi:uncharacterized protein DUF4129